MQSLKDLISRLPVPGLKESYERGRIAEVVSNSCGITVRSAAVSVREGTVYIQAPPVLKSLLILRKEAIITSLRSEGITVQDIR